MSENISSNYVTRENPFYRAPNDQSKATDQSDTIKSLGRFIKTHVHTETTKKMVDVLKAQSASLFLHLDPIDVKNPLTPVATKTGKQVSRNASFIPNQKEREKIKKEEGIGILKEVIVKTPVPKLDEHGEPVKDEHGNIVMERDENNHIITTEHTEYQEITKRKDNVNLIVAGRTINLTRNIFYKTLGVGGTITGQAIGSAVGGAVGAVMAGLFLARVYKPTPKLPGNPAADAITRAAAFAKTPNKEEAYEIFKENVSNGSEIGRKAGRETVKTPVKIATQCIKNFGDALILKGLGVDNKPGL